MNSAILIYSTFPNSEIAEEVSNKLLTANLIACANIGGGIKSLYKWNKTIEKSSEIPVLFKSVKGKFLEIENLIKQHHPYKIPCIISVDIDNISPDFLTWILENTKN
ncbi:MAG: divalent-cation tolerance protein CutA [Rickettsiales bacterium]|nr:divalent-cation tolerance protein CutA [Rickettsiales bacterium]